MSDTDFYNLNLYRNYPFADESRGLIWPITEDHRGALLDIGIVLLPNSEFDFSNNEHRILPFIIGELSNIGLYIHAPGAAVHGTVFGVYPNADISRQRSSFKITNSNVVYGFGWLIHGIPQTNGFSNQWLSSSSSVVNNYSTYISNSPLTLPYIEPRCIQILTGHYVNKFIIANEPRVTVPNSRPGMSSSSVIISGVYPVAPGGEGVQGAIKFKEGYNCQITVISRSNALRFSARKGAGLGEACEEVPRTYAELDLAARSEYLDHATRCHEGISAINGVPPDTSGNFIIQGGLGVSITSSGTNTIRISGHESMENC